MRNYILKRIFTAVILIFIITVINFILINLAPGNPVDAMIDPNASQEVIQLKKEALGLNGPLYVRYFKWLINVLHGNLGFPDDFLSHHAHANPELSFSADWVRHCHTAWDCKRRKTIFQI